MRFPRRYRYHGYSVWVSLDVYGGRNLGGVFVRLILRGILPGHGSIIDEISMPLEVFANSLLRMAGSLQRSSQPIIPTIFIMILGCFHNCKTIRDLDTTVGWSMFVLFFVSVAILSVAIPKIVYSFKEDGRITR